MNTPHRFEQALEEKITQGLLFSKKNEWISAEKTFLAALALSPEHPMLWNYLGNVVKQQGKHELAILHYEKAIKYNELPYPEAEHNLATVYEQLGNYDQALQHYAKALQAAPHFIEAHFHLGLLFLKYQKNKEANIQFNNVLALNKNHIKANLIKATLEFDDDQLERAKERLSHLVLQIPHLAEAWNLLGAIALKEQDGQNAINHFAKALAHSNEDENFQSNLANAYLHFDRFDNACIHYDVLLKKSPKNTEYLYNKGFCLMRLGHLQEAKILFETLLSENPKKTDARTNLATIYLREGKKNIAKNLLSEVICQNPKDNVSRHMLNALTNTESDTCNEYTKNLFNQYASNYDTHLLNTLQYTLPKQWPLLMKATQIEWSPHILDLGCGTGLLGEALLPLTDCLWGVDISEKMLRYCEKKNIYHRLFCEDVLTFLKETTAFFSLITLADVLPYIGDLLPLFEAMAARLKQNGTILCTSEISHTKDWKLEPTGRFSHHPNYLINLANKVGLKVSHHSQIIGRSQENEPVWLSFMAFTI